MSIESRRADLIKLAKFTAGGVATMLTACDAPISPCSDIDTTLLDRISEKDEKIGVLEQQIAQLQAQLDNKPLQTPEAKDPEAESTITERIVESLRFQSDNIGQFTAVNEPRLAGWPVGAAHPLLIASDTDNLTVGNFYSELYTSDNIAGCKIIIPDPYTAVGLNVKVKTPNPTVIHAIDLYQLLPLANRAQILNEFVQEYYLPRHFANEQQGITLFDVHYDSIAQPHVLPFDARAEEKELFWQLVENTFYKNFDYAQQVGNTKIDIR